MNSLFGMHYLFRILQLIPYFTTNSILYNLCRVLQCCLWYSSSLAMCLAVRTSVQRPVSSSPARTLTCVVMANVTHLFVRELVTNVLRAKDNIFFT